MFASFANTRSAEPHLSSKLFLMFNKSLAYKGDVEIVVIKEKKIWQTIPFRSRLQL